MISQPLLSGVAAIEELRRVVAPAHERIGFGGRFVALVLGCQRLVGEIEVVENLLAAARGHRAENGRLRHGGSLELDQEIAVEARADVGGDALAAADEPVVPPG